MQGIAPSSILSQLAEDLAKWARDRKGEVSVAQDPFRVLEVLWERPVGFRVIVHWAGDRPIEGGPDAVPISTNRIEVYLSYNLGLTAKLDVALMTGEPDRPSMLAMTEACRARLLSYTFPQATTGAILRYAGCEPVTTPDGYPLAAYKLSFELDGAVKTDALRDPQ